MKKKTYFLKYYDEDHPKTAGYGEAALFEGLSVEDTPEFESKLVELSRSVRENLQCDISNYSSIIFGFEQAVKDYENGGIGLYFPSAFSKGEKTIDINGLIWMGSRKEMIERINQKIDGGYDCIKIKIGAIEWKDELYLLELIRELTEGKTIDLRVDANGAFSNADCLKKLGDLEKFHLHSIEQPIKAGDWDFMKKICEESPVPIALDEELIGISEEEERERLVEYIKPQYVVLKPALCFGFAGAESWIRIAEKHNTGWWITSALESAVGLDAIAQFTGNFELKMAQGLGTGALYTNNFSSPLVLEGSKLSLKKPTDIFRSELENLKWREY